MECILCLPTVPGHGTLECGWHTHWRWLEKPVFLLPESISHNNLLVRVAPCVARACAAPCMLPQSLWVHTCTSSAVSGRRFLCCHHFLWLLTVFLLLLARRSLSLEETSLMKTYHLVRSAPELLTLHGVYVWVSEFSYWQKLFWQRLS